MSENPFLAKWRDVRFAYTTNDTNTDTIVLIFEDLDTGRNAIRFLQSWGYITLAFVKKPKGGIDIHLYDDTNPDKYSLISPDNPQWERDDIIDFIDHRPFNLRTPIICGTYVGEELKSSEPSEGLTVYVNGYVYANENNFRFQRLSDRN